MDWDLLDYFAASILIGGTIFGIFFSQRHFSRPWQRILATLILITGLVLIWAQLAVGVI